MTTFSSKPWSGFSESDYDTPAAFCAACLIDLNPNGQAKTKANCKLPVKEPGGAVNRNALGAAAAVLAGARGGVQAPADAKKAAARRLMRLYGEAKMDPPESLMRMTSGS